MDITDKFLKFDGGAGGKKKAPRRHLSSADGHARRARMARARKTHPKLVDQLMKDIRYELSVGSSASNVSRMRNMEQMRRMMGAMATRSFLQRAMFKRTARAFFHWLCDGVDHAHVAHLRKEIEVHKEIVEVHRTTNIEIEQKHASRNDEFLALKQELSRYRKILAGDRGQFLIPILEKTRIRLLNINLQRWHKRIFAETHAKAQLARAASYFSNRQLRLAWDSFSFYYRGRSSLKLALIKLGEGKIRRLQSQSLKTWVSETVGPGSAKAARREIKKLRGQHKIVCVRYLIALLRHNHVHVQEKAFASWKYDVMNEKRHELILSRASRKLRQKLLHQWLNRWKDGVAKEKFKRKKILGILKKTRMRLLRGSFGFGGWCQWQTLILEREVEEEIIKIRIQRVLGRLCHTKTSSAWQSWKLQVEAARREELIIRRAAARIKLRTLSAAMSSWCDFVAQRYADRKLMNRTFRALIRQNVAAALRQWGNFVQWHQNEEIMQKKRDSAMIRIFRRLDSSQLNTGWQSWIFFLKEEKRRMTLLKRAQARMANRQAKAAWLSWLSFRNDRRYARKLAGRVFGRIVLSKIAASFFSWCQYLKFLDEKLAERNYQRRLMLRILSRLANANVCKSFTIWANAYKEARRLEVVLTRAATRLKNRTTKAAFEGWRLSVLKLLNDRKIAWKVLSRLANAKRLSAFNSWHLFMKTCQQRDEIKLRIAARIKNRIAVAALNTWKESVRDSIEKRLLLRRAAAKLVKRALVQTFEAWADWSEDQRLLRKRVSRILVRMMNAFLIAGFNKWQEDTRLKRENENGLRRAIGMFRNRKLSMSWNTWSQKIRALIRYRYITQKFLQKMSLRVIRGAFLGWSDIVYERKRNRVAVSRILAKMRLRKASAALDSWIHFTQHRQHQRNLVRRIMSRLLQNKKYAAWNTWVTISNEGRRIDYLRTKAAARWRNKTTRAALQTWISYTDELIQMRNKLKRAVAKFRNRKTNAAFLTWHGTVKDIVKYRVLIRRVAMRIQNKSTVAAMGRWCEFTKERRDARLLAKRVMSRLVNTKLYAAWRAWMAIVNDYKRYIKILARAKMRMTNRLLTASWASWQSLVEESKRNRNLLRRAAQKIRKRQMVMCFETWAEQIWEKRRNENAVAKGLKMWKNRTLGQAFQGWMYSVKERVRNRIIVKRTLKKMTMRRLNSAFNSWDDFTLERQTSRKLLKHVFRKLLNKKLSVAWRSWLRRLEVLRWEHQLASLGDDEQKAIRDRKRWQEQRARVEALELQRRERAMRRVITRVQNRCLLLTLDAWMHFTSESQRQKTILKRAAAKMMLRTLSIAFEGWSDAVNTILSNRAKVRRVLMRMQQRIKVISFEAWIELVEKQKRTRIADASVQAPKLTPQERQCKRIIFRMMNRILVSALDAWKSQTLEHRRLETLLARVMKRWKNKAKAECFDAWYNAIQQRIAHRVIVTRAAAKWRLRAAAACLKRWTDFCFERKRNRTVVARCVAKIKGRLLSSSFEGWRSNLLEGKRLRGLLARAAMKMKMRTAGTAFFTWNEYLANSKRTKTLLARAALRIKNRQASQAFESWRSHWMTKTKIKLFLKQILLRKRKKLVKIAWVLWYIKVVSYKASIGKNNFCSRCKRKIRKQRKELLREQNWDSSPSNGIPAMSHYPSPSLIQSDTAIDQKSWGYLTSASDAHKAENKASNTKRDEKGLPKGANKRTSNLDAGGSSYSLAHSHILRGNTAALDSPSGSGLHGARSLASAARSNEFLKQSAAEELAALRAKSRKASREANLLKERVHQIESQYELRLQITIQRGEERQKQLSNLIEKQKADLENLQKQRDIQASRHAKETSALKSENGILRAEIKEKQNGLQQSIAARHTMEESLIEMSRWFRKKGKSTDQMNAMLTRISLTLRNNSIKSIDTRVGVKLMETSQDLHGEPMYVSSYNDMQLSQQSQHDFQGEFEQASLRIAQAEAEYQHILKINESLQEELLHTKTIASESSAASKRIQEESRGAIMDIASRASKQLKHQQERCNSLESSIQQLQEQLHEEKNAHLAEIKTLENDLILAKQTVRKKELELEIYERKYATLKTEFDELSERRLIPGPLSQSARPQTSSVGENRGTSSRLLLPSRDAYVAWSN